MIGAGVLAGATTGSRPAVVSLPRRTMLTVAPLARTRSMACMRVLAVSRWRRGRGAGRGEGRARRAHCLRRDQPGWRQQTRNSRMRECSVVSD